MVKLLFALLSLSIALPAIAEPSDDLLIRINAHVVRVQVLLENGSFGVGSGVVIAKDQIVTNCHVISNAVGIEVVSQGESYAVTAIKPDWRHDVCIVKAEGIKAPIAKLGSSDLKYEQPVFAIGYPGFSPIADTTFGYVKGLFEMDGSHVIRATSSFRLGDSGGGLFDAEGRLVGITTLKSPGRIAFYYNMPVEWAQALIDQPEQPVRSKGELPFWATNMEQWPYFMKVVQPYQTEDWLALTQIASEWAEKEPKSSEALFYLASAKYATGDTSEAELLFHKVVAMNNQHSASMYYIGLIDEANGKHMEAMTTLAILDTLDSLTAEKLKTAFDGD